MIDYNGKIIPADAPVLDVYNRGFNYADGLFETMRFQNGKILFSEDHLQRLLYGMKVLKMEIPTFFKVEYFERQILKLIEVNKFKEQVFRVKLNVFREAEGLYQPNFQKTAYLLNIRPISFFSDDFSTNYKMNVFPDHHISPGILSQLKTIARLLNVLSGIYAEENKLQNCLLLNTDQRIAEATNGNIFVVKEKSIFTPPIEEACINGVLRKNLISLIKSSDYEFIEKPLSEEDIGEAEELWVTNVIVGIQPVTHFRTRTYSMKVAKEFMEKLIRI